jgi:hypothetical protein
MGGQEFCGFSDATDSDLVRRCYKDKYESFHAISLMNLREAIGRNEDTIAKLVTGRAKNGEVTTGSKVIDFNEEEDTYIPDVLSVHDLKAQYQKSVAQDPTKLSRTKIENQKWVSELLIPGKTPDLVEFKKVSKDGEKSIKESPLNMVNQDDQGNAKKDTKLSKLLEAHLKKPEVQEEIKNAKDRLKNSKLTPIKADVAVKNFERDIIGENGQGPEDRISADAFSYARNQILYRLDEGKKALTEEQTVDSYGNPIIKTASSKENENKTEAKEKASATNSKKEASSLTVNSDQFKMKNEKELAAIYSQESKFKKPAENQNSNYIRYDLDELLSDIPGYVP